MADEWQKYSIGELCELGVASVQTGPFGSQLHAHEYVEDGIPVVSTEAIFERHIDHSLLHKITPEKAQSLDRHKLLAGDILFARRGVQATGHVGYVRPVEEGFMCGTGAIRLRLRPNNDLISPEFLSHVLANPESVEWFKFHAIGATMPNLNESIIRRFIVALPPLPEQRAIAHILGTLDDKIEVNRRMNRTLEAMARALFQSWFVEFDPVRAKARGKAPPGLAPELAARFPDRLVETELGKLPEGWEVETLGNVAEVVKGRSYRSSDLQDSDTALVTLKSFQRGGGYRPDGLKAYTGTYLPAQVIEPGELIVAYTDVTQQADVIGKPALVRNDQAYRTLVASLDVGIVRPKRSEVSRYYLYSLFLTDGFQNHTYAHSNGSTVLHLSKNAVRSFEFLLPPNRVLDTFHDVVWPMYQRIDANEAENSNLESLRDTLLPKLMSGEVRVPEVEEMIGV